jgi:hypothetical protein
MRSIRTRPEVAVADITVVTDVAVVVPARDESHCVARSIAAIARAARRAVGVSGGVVGGDDARTATTRAVAEQALTANEVSGCVVRTLAGSASMARRAGVAEVVRTTPRPERCWVLSTDADSEVPIDWIERYLQHAERGAVAVAGVVDLIDDHDAAGFVDRWRSDYGATLGDDGRHPHVHAANLGVRLDAYVRVGGFGDLARAEDIDLWRRLRSIGVEPVADASIVVWTSGRRHGRVAQGFAHALALAYPTDDGSVAARSHGGPQRVTPASSG